jgi:hypothetical protein
VRLRDVVEGQGHDGCGPLYLNRICHRCELGKPAQGPDDRQENEVVEGTDVYAVVIYGIGSFCDQVHHN